MRTLKTFPTRYSQVYILDGRQTKEEVARRALFMQPPPAFFFDATRHVPARLPPCRGRYGSLGCSYWPCESRCQPTAAHRTPPSSPSVKDPRGHPLVTQSRSTAQNTSPYESSSATVQYTKGRPAVGRWAATLESKPREHMRKLFSLALAELKSQRPRDFTWDFKHSLHKPGRASCAWQ